jgi:undecaprenyl-diphosphatase
MGWLVIIGSLPIGILGLVFSDQIETVARNLWLVSFTLIGFGIVLGIADRTARGTKTLEDLTVRDGLLFGMWQAAALVPGVSRSGASISGGLFMGYTREAATRYAFLLAIPAVMASGLYEALAIAEDPAVAWGPTILATAIAFGVGLSVIAWLLRYISVRTIAATLTAFVAALILGFSIEGYVFAAVTFWIFCFGMSRYSQALERKLHTGH